MKVFIGKDQDCHNYLIPVAKRKDWEDWRDFDTSDDLPSYAIPIDGVSDIEFEYGPQYQNLEKALDHETLFLDKTREGFEGGLEPAYGAASGKRCVVLGESLVQVLEEMEKQLNKNNE